MDEVLQMMMVRSISEPPVFGSTSFGNSEMVSTTSPARSPQATTTTTSTAECREIKFCRTVFPGPNGAGIHPVPPRAIGKKVSMIRCGNQGLVGIESFRVSLFEKLLRQSATHRPSLLHCQSRFVAPMITDSRDRRI